MLHTRYHTLHEVSGKAIPSRAQDLVGRDSRQNYVYKRLPNQLVRFGDYHPRTNQEAFFYNVLLSLIPFNEESELFSEGNTTNSYFIECMMRDDPSPDAARAGKKILHDDDDLEDMVTAYCERHMFRWVGIFGYRYKL